jgi:DNA-directed RNA polymerase subunit RPC12/RpoP
MPELKFSCAQCGQHISCDELWAGQQIQCPACKNTLVVPGAHAAPPAPPAATTPTQVSHAPTTGRPKLAARATQMERATPANVADHRRSLPRPPKGENAPLKYAIIGVLLLALGGVAYHYVPGLLGKVQEMETPIGASGPATGG